MNPDEIEQFRFDTFTLIPARRTLQSADSVVRLGGRALDLLVELVRHAGRPVTKEQLTAAAWPRTIVDEARLRVHVSALRKLLGGPSGGTQYIRSIPGIGYSFVAQVVREVQAMSCTPRASGLPARQVRLIGRDGAVRALLDDLDAHRFVNIVGPGGIGKSSLALAVAEQMLPRLADSAHFVDLALVSDPDMVTNAVAAALGLVQDRGVQLAALFARVGRRHALVLLDNCEHVANGVAQVAATLLRAAPMVRILATSREVLHAPDEMVHRLQSLALPPEGSTQTAAAAMRYASIQLLVDRAGGSRDGFRLSDAEAELAAQLCRRLDGLPLAIELAAGQLGGMGLRELLARHASPLDIPGPGSAQAGTWPLREALASSHEALSTQARRVLRRLSVFASHFTLQVAKTVACDAEIDEDVLLEAIMELANKSLLSPNLQDDVARYRLLETTRAFAAQQLAAAGEEPALQGRHIGCIHEALETAAQDWPRIPRDEWIARHGALIDDVRLALDRACAAGRWEAAAQLTAAAFPYGHQLSLLDEFRWRVEQVLPHVRELGTAHADLELKLLASLIALLGQTKGITPAMVEAQHRANALTSGPRALRADAETWRAMWAGSFGVADYRSAMRHVDSLARIAAERKDAALSLVVERMRAQTLHFMGHHDSAITLAEGILQQLGADDSPSGRSVHPVDPRASLRIVLARSHWLNGRTALARALADEALAHASVGVGYSFCQALGLAVCPIAIWSGDLSRAAQLAHRLANYAAAHGLHQWQLWGQNFLAVLAGQPVSIHPADHKQRDLFMTLSPALFDEKDLADVQRRAAGWCEPEVLRLAAEHAHGRSPEAAEGGTLLAQAIALARAQGAALWELRASLTSARWTDGHGMQPPAEQLARLVERFALADGAPELQFARCLIERTR